jgi:hypothetical protein
VVDIFVVTVMCALTRQEKRARVSYKRHAGAYRSGEGINGGLVVWKADSQQTRKREVRNDQTTATLTDCWRLA